MSDDVLRDERGRVIKGSPGLHRKQEPQQDIQPDNPPAEPPPDNLEDFDAVLLYVARNFGRSGLPRVGLIGYCANLMDERPVEFAAQLSKASARRGEASSVAGSGGPSVQVSFVTAPSGMYVDENGKLQEEPTARAEWARKTGVVITDEPPPFSPPTLVTAPPQDRPALGALLTKAEIDAMSEAEIAAKIKAGVIEFVGDDE